MRARGEQLAKEQRYTEAIDAFKAAEKLEPRARHSCLIALVYIRREQWPQAEIFLEQCEKRSTLADPAPEWVPTAKQQLADRLSSVNVAPVDIRVLPAEAQVKLSVSSFAPDELFEPRAIHLPPGRHVVSATAPGYTDAEVTVTVTDRSPQTVTITLGTPTVVREGERVALPAAPPSKVPLVVMGAGVGLGAIGAVVHLTAMWGARKDAIAADENGMIAERDQRMDDFRTWRTVTAALYIAGGATLITGAVLKYTVFAGEEPPAQVAVTPLEGGGGMVSIGWSR